MAGTSKAGLSGRRILVAEDNLFAAMELEQTLADLGCRVVGPAAKAELALALARSEPLDGAVLDVDLRGTPAFSVAAALEQRGIPVIFATAHPSGSFPERFARHPRLSKPYFARDLARALEANLPPAA